MYILSCHYASEKSELTERFSNLPRATHLVSSSAEIWTRKSTLRAHALKHYTFSLACTIHVCANFIETEHKTQSSAQIRCVTQWIFTKWAHLCNSNPPQRTEHYQPPPGDPNIPHPSLYPFPTKGNTLLNSLTSLLGVSSLSVYFNHTVFQVSWGLLLKLKIFYFAGTEVRMVEGTHSLDKRSDWGWES